MNTSPASRVELLKDRAHMMQEARTFFAARNILEVDCPILTQGAPIELHLDPMTLCHGGEIRYLHTSPEYGMKRLLAEGMGDIFQISHVFREGELGHLHNPEFTLVEWYQKNISFSAFIEETLDFMRLFLGPLPSSTLTYREAFQKYASLDYVPATLPDLIACAHAHDLTPPTNCDKDTLLQYLLTALVEPRLTALTVLSHYPASQAALAQTRWQGDEEVAERFEIYYKGIELCNGFHELADPHEQKRRFVESNTQRQAIGKSSLTIDDHFLDALHLGLPDCCGVAVGFDRLLMLRHNLPTLAPILPFPWQNA